MTKVPVMAHLVAGYTSPEISLEAARGLASGGVSYFEVQFPFSDPSADGKAIQTACAAVLSGGWRVDDGFAFVETLRSEFPGIPVFVMTYANLAYKIGISAFVERSFRSGVSGLIIPDLPFDADEGLAAACDAKGIACVPVAAPSMTESRIASLAALRRPYVYAALRSGITGSSTSIDDGTLAFLSSLKASESRILGGFGIRSGDQSGALAPAVHAVVAGSVFVDIIREKSGEGGEAVRLAVQAKAAELSNPVQR
ncbi:MAG: tryptophan synthase subunit alpha [Spirochaetales bacterium]|nr:tryptophan synthase subunit alpha [Spirochaetales bacterium]